MPKTPEMQSFVEKMGENLFGRKWKEGECISCGKNKLVFRDELSRKEYQLSHMCQECQDSVFGPMAGLDSLGLE